MASQLIRLAGGPRSTAHSYRLFATPTSNCVLEHLHIAALYIRDDCFPGPLQHSHQRPGMVSTWASLELRYQLLDMTSDKNLEGISFEARLYIYLSFPLFLSALVGLGFTIRFAVLRVYYYRSMRSKCLASEKGKGDYS